MVFFLPWSSWENMHSMQLLGFDHFSLVCGAPWGSLLGNAVDYLGPLSRGGQALKVMEMPGTL